MTTLRPLSEASDALWRGLRFVFTDIDDTLTTDGVLPSVAYVALERLKAAGLTVVPVTGRPAGWCDMVARFWPVDAVVGENGAFYFRYLHGERRMVRRHAMSDQERGAARQRLARLAEEIPALVPGAAIAADQSYREADLAIDFCEDVPRLDDAAIARIVALFEAAGATAKVSSIHVNGWFGRHDKLSMTKTLLADEFGVALDAAVQMATFAGDSPNDAPMFAAFPDAVGVANVRDMANRCAALPRWITAARGGEGFAELADAILSARGRAG